MAVRCASCNRLVESKGELLKTFNLGKVVKVCYFCCRQTVGDYKGHIAPLNVIKLKDIVSSLLAIGLALVLFMTRFFVSFSLVLCGAVLIDLFTWIHHYRIVRSEEEVLKQYHKNKSYSSRLIQEHIDEYESIYDYYRAFDSVEHLMDKMDKPEYDIRLKGISRGLIHVGILLSRFLDRFKFISISFYVTIFVILSIGLFYLSLVFGVKLFGPINNLFQWMSGR